MGLFKRKPVDSSPSPTKNESLEKETRRRHRLSKPQTSNSTTNLASQPLANRSRVDVVSESPITPVLSKPTTETVQALSKPPISGNDLERIQARTRFERQALPNATVVVQAVDGKHENRDNPSPAALQVQKSRRPFSTMFMPRRSSNSQLNRDSSLGTNPDSPLPSMTSSSSPVSAEDTYEGVSRLDRRASFTPGAATRIEKEIVCKPVPTRAETAPRLHKKMSHEIDETDRFYGTNHEYIYDGTRSKLSLSGQPEFLDYERDWTPPLQIFRTETPLGLDYTHLGGLRLGSLHVVNGRASPVPSDLSRLMCRPSGLRRDASSEYGGSEVGSVATDLGLGDTQRVRTPPPSARKGFQVREKSQLQNASSSPVRQDDEDLIASIETDPWPERSTPSLKSMPRPSNNKASVMAEMYMAELPPSPYSERRSQSPVGSAVWTATRTSDYEDDLFEDEAVDESAYGETVEESVDTEADRATVSTCRTASPTTSDTTSQHDDRFGSFIDRSKPRSGEHLQLLHTKRTEASDSGYSSNTSLPSLVESISLVAQRIKAFEKPLEAVKTHNPATSLEKVEERKAGPRSFRPILKQNRATAPALPTFMNLYPSTTSIATSQSTETSTASILKSPRKLQKKRQSSQPVLVEDIMVQGSHSVDGNSVPPIPDHQRANLNARVSQVPELQRTFKTMHHTKDYESSVGSPFSPVEIRFPSPNPENMLDETLSHSSRHVPTPTSKPRDSFMARAWGARRMSQQDRSSEVSEKDAVAIVNQFESTTSALGGPSPYEIARNATSRPLSRNGSPHGRNPNNTLVKANRPKSMMDDREASAFARNKSKSIFERDRRLSAERHTSFNDGGNAAAKGPRPQSFVNPRSFAPPRPQSATPRPFPARVNETYLHREPWDKQYQQPRFEDMYNGDGGSLDQYESPAPPPPTHSPCPSFVEPEEEVEELVLAPPPPSHSPRPVILDSEDQVPDIWAAQAQAWKNRRKSLGEFLGHDQTNNTDYEETYDEARPAQEELYPVIPPRRPQSSFVRSAPAWQPDTQHHGAAIEPNRYQSSSRALPAPSRESYVEDVIRKPRSRRVSQSNSYAGSYANSLAEELHPSYLERAHHPPQFGRYSGGMDYGYEHGAGFGGSAGTRSFSGVAEGTRKGLPLSTGFGIDLSDVPIIAGLQKF